MMFLGLFDDIGTIFLGLLRQAVMTIIANLYNLIATFYNIFMYITKVNILTGSNKSLVSDIYNRIQVILAVVMVFYVTLEFVKYIVNPETFSDKEKGGGGLLKRILIVIVLMAFTPQIFGMAYDLQNRIISSEVIPKVLIKDYDPKDYGDNAGGQFSSNLLGMFYKPFVTSEGNTPKGTCGDKRTAQQVVDDNLKALETKGRMVNATYCIATAGDDVIDGGEKHVNPYLIQMGLGGLLPIVIGGFMFWILINYCAEAARVIIQFVFLQIIAPVPILSYIAPGKDGMFNKWVKQCTTTYLDLFIRLFIMYLVLMLSQILLALDIDVIFGSINFPKDSWIPLWVKLFLFIGLLMFAMKAPKMVKELLPGGSNAASGDFGIGAKSTKERLDSVRNPAKSVWNAGVKTNNARRRVVGTVRGAGAGLGAAWRERKNVADPDKGNKFTRGLTRLHSGSKAVVAGVKAGAVKGGNSRKAIEAARGSVQKDVEVVDKGGTVLGHDFRWSQYQKLDVKNKRVVSSYEEVIEKKKNISTYTDNMKVIKQFNDWKQTAISAGDNVKADAIGAQIKNLEKQLRITAVNGDYNALETVINDAITASGNSLPPGVTVDKLLERGSPKFDAISTSLSEFNRVVNSVGEVTTSINGVDMKIGEVTIKDKNGIDRKINSLTNEERAEYAGDIEDKIASLKVSKMAESEYREAQANASGGSDTKK